jgi:thiol-disulfide isomerase/thioredoxin
MDYMTHWRTAVAVVAATGLALSAYAADIPRPAPELAIRMINGPELLLNKYRGKVVALEFILTTCPHCQRTARTMSKLNQELGPRGFQPLGVAINDMAQMLIPEFVRNQQVNYPVGYGSRELASGFLQHPVMLQMMMPQIVFIDRKGTIRAQYAGTDKFFLDEEKNMRETVLGLLNEPAAAPAKTTTKKAAASKKTS